MALPQALYKKRSTVLVEVERGASVQSYEQESSCKRKRVAGIPGELQREGKVEVAMKMERTAPSCCFLLPSLQNS